jgi:hypothetical protein
MYARFDASLRPLLAMGAAFLPSLADTIDVGKLPPSEIVSRHLGPTVMSQSYRGDGYVAESIGSVPLFQTIIGAVTATTAASTLYQLQSQPAPIQQTITAPPISSPSPSPSPSGSP